MSDENVLAMLDSIAKAKAFLAETRDLTKIVNVWDSAATAETWARARHSDEAAMLALEVKLRAERKAGEVLADMKENGILSKGAAEPRSNIMLPRPTLASLGIEKMESVRWQRVATIPEDQPWQYEFSLSYRGDLERHYDTMTVEEILALAVQSAENAVLFLWATNTKLIILIPDS